MEHLTIYPKHPAADAYRVGGFYSPYCLVATNKRFSDAELAAEYWHSTSNYHAAAFLRFGSAKHFDEGLS